MSLEPGLLVVCHLTTFQETRTPPRGSARAPLRAWRLLGRRDLVHPVGEVSVRVVEFVGGLVGLPGAAVDQHAQMARLPDGQLLGEGAVGLPADGSRSGKVHSTAMRPRSGVAEGSPSLRPIPRQCRILFRGFRRTGTSVRSSRAGTWWPRCYESRCLWRLENRGRDRNPGCYSDLARRPNGQSIHLHRNGIRRTAPPSPADPVGTDSRRRGKRPGQNRSA
jgi:hypothetical protein